MKRRAYIAYALSALVLLASLIPLASCRTAPPARPDTAPSVAIDGSTMYCTISWGKRGAYTLSGQAEQLDGSSYSVTLERLDWFNNWQDGWTEASVPLEGKLLLSEAGGSWTASKIEKPVPARTSAAQIRHRNTILEGNQAADLFDRRLERVRATAAWLASESSFSPADGNQFFARAGKVLFPEQNGYPEGTGQSAVNAEFKAGEGMKWNRTYTEQSIPEHLREVRDSGTLWRDWEESRELFYIAYTWEK